MVLTCKQNVGHFVFILFKKSIISFKKAKKADRKGRVVAQGGYGANLCGTIEQSPLFYTPPAPELTRPSSAALIALSINNSSRILAYH